MAKGTFRQQVLQAREDAIVQAVNRQLATRGYELMTMDDIADEVGIAKPSLYKHFRSKEDLAAAAMVRVLDRTLDFMDEREAMPQATPLEQLCAVVRWSMRVQLSGEMPSLPAHNSHLREFLLQSPAYVERFMRMNQRLWGWVVKAQQSGQIRPDLPADVVLYSAYARACDPVLGVLKSMGVHDTDTIIEWVMSMWLQGVNGPLPATKNPHA